MILFHYNITVEIKFLLVVIVGGKEYWWWL
jgi:hypothetical protein